MKLVFKKAILDDVSDIVSLCNECFNENTDLEYARNSFIETMNNPNHIYLIGRVDNVAVAHLKITIIPTMYQPMSTYAILNHVCVKPDYRRHNIATHMLDVAKKLCIQKGCAKIELWSNNSRQAAHSCYKNYGFGIDDAKFFSLDISK